MRVLGVFLGAGHQTDTDRDTCLLMEILSSQIILSNSCIIFSDGNSAMKNCKLKCMMGGTRESVLPLGVSTLLSHLYCEDFSRFFFSTVRN